jgi:Leucine-rich repeat (LRR) protein
MAFRKQLQEKLGPHEPNEVDELILDELFVNVDAFNDDHKKSLELYSSLVHLSLNGFGLKSLKHFPKIATLTSLELRQNHLSGSDFGDLKTLYPNLKKLKVGENPIKSLEVFKVLTTFGELQKLEVQGADVTNKETYRDELFKMLPKVEVSLNF